MVFYLKIHKDLCSVTIKIQGIVFSKKLNYNNQYFQLYC